MKSAMLLILFNWHDLLAFLKIEAFSTANDSDTQRWGPGVVKSNVGIAAVFHHHFLSGRRHFNEFPSKIFSFFFRFSAFRVIIHLNVHDRCEASMQMRPVLILPIHIQNLHIFLPCVSLQMLPQDILKPAIDINPQLIISSLLATVSIDNRSDYDAVIDNFALRIQKQCVQSHLTVIILRQVQQVHIIGDDTLHKLAGLAPSDYQQFSACKFSEIKLTIKDRGSSGQTKAESSQASCHTPVYHRNLVNNSSGDLQITTNQVIKCMQQCLRQYTSISHRIVSSFARRKLLTTHHLPRLDRDQQMAIRLQHIYHKLRNRIEKQDSQGCQRLFDELFWENTHDPEQILAMYPMKNSVDYYLRDYPTLIMDLENELHFHKKVYSSSPHRAQSPQEPKEVVEENRSIRKMLVLLLWNKGRLQSLLKDSQTTNAFILSGYVKAVCQLVTGDPRKAEQSLLSIINNRFLDQDPQLRVLVRYPKQKSMNLKQQALWNMLIYNMYSSSPAGRRGRALELFNKLKQQQDLTVDDLVLGDDYENFLNIWFSYRFDQPLEWSDVSSKELEPFYKFIYMLAETHYLAKQKWEAKRILEGLPRKYPQRVFLEMSSLYDVKEYEQMHGVARRLISDKHCKYIKNPENDEVIYNILKLLRRITTSKQEAMAMQQKMYVVSATLNLDIKHERREENLPAHYLILPMKQYLVHEKLNWLFEDTRSDESTQS